MNKMLYKLVLSMAFVLQINNFNLSYSSESKDITFLVNDNGECVIKQQNEVYSTEEYNTDKYNHNKIHNSNKCIAQVRDNDIQNNIDSSNYMKNYNITEYNNAVYNVENNIGELVKSNNEVSEYCKAFLQNNNNIDKEQDYKVFIQDINDIDIKEILKPDVNITYDTTPISAIVSSYITNYETITITPFYDFDPKDLKLDYDYKVNLSQLLNSVVTAGISEEKTCCSWLRNVFNKATSCIKNVFSSNKNTVYNDMQEKLINNDLNVNTIDNNDKYKDYDAGISSSNSKDSMTYSSEDDPSTSINKSSFIYNSDED